MSKKDLKRAEKATAEAHATLEAKRAYAEESVQNYDMREEIKRQAEEDLREAHRVKKLAEKNKAPVKLNLDGQPVWKTPRTLRGSCVSWEDARTLASRQVYCEEYSESLNQGDSEQVAKHQAWLAARKALQGEVHCDRIDF